MNQQIQELMLQAGTDTSGKWMGVEHAEKFAQLIVQECLAQIDKVRDSCDGDEAEQELGAAWAGLAVARHFGVE